MVERADNVKKGVYFGLATALVGSTAAAAGKLVAAEVAVPMVVFIQYSICLIFILPRMLVGRRESLLSAYWPTHLIRGAGGLLSFYAYFLALANMPLVEANLLRNSAPLFVPLVVLLWLRVVVPKKRWLSLIVGFVGIALILKPDVNTEELSATYIWGVLSGLLLAVSMVGTRVLSRHESSSKIIFYYFGLSFLISLPVALWHWQAVPLFAWPYLLYLGLSIFLAMWLYTKAYSYAKPSIVAPISYFSVVFSGFIGWVFWGYVPGLWSLLGILLVVCAGIVTAYTGADN